MRSPASQNNAKSEDRAESEKIHTNILTRQTWHDNEDGTRTFDSPIETGGNLDSHQGKVPGFMGTCGIVSCVNMFLLAGLQMSETVLVNYAKRHSLCTTCRGSQLNGGTSASDRKALLSAFGLNSSLEKCTIESIANRVEEGRGVIISVKPSILYYGYESGLLSELHAVVVTATKRDKSGNLLGFYLCDSNDRPSVYYPAYTLNQALTGNAMNVTDQVLR